MDPEPWSLTLMMGGASSFGNQSATTSLGSTLKPGFSRSLAVATDDTYEVGAADRQIVVLSIGATDVNLGMPEFDVVLDLELYDRCHVGKNLFDKRLAICVARELSNLYAFTGCERLTHKV